MRIRQTSSWQFRPGVVLLAVLVVDVILTLAASQYTTLIMAELKATYNTHNSLQARAFADSGVHYTAMMLSSPDNITNFLNGNPYHNPERFGNVSVPANQGISGRFRLIAPLDPDDSQSSEPYRSGVTDEGGKINLNALIKRDPTGQRALDALMKLPNMTEEIAGSIVDWIDADTDPRQGGAENDYYSGLNPPYRCKNGGLDSIEELLLVKGVTRELLYGTDFNRNGFQDLDESTPDSTNRGWINYLTIYSRESNRDGDGNQLAYINDSNLSNVYNALVTNVNEDMAKFVVLYRQYGAASSSGKTQSFGNTLATIFGGGKSKGGGGNTPAAPKTVAGNLAEYQPNLTKSARQKINSFFDLVNAQVAVAGKDSKSPTTIYTSPLKDPNAQQELLPKLYEVLSLFKDSDISGRINVNTAPREVLASLAELTDAEVQTILSARPKYSSSDSQGDIYQTPAWLLTQANLNVTTLQKVEKYITTKAQVYRVQVEGFFDDGEGPRSRVEAVIDTNGGRPRVLLWRDLSELGRNPVVPR